MVDKMFTEKELLEMEFWYVLSYIKFTQQRRESKGIQKDLEVCSTVKSRKLTLSSRCLQRQGTKELSKTPASQRKINDRGEYQILQQCQLLTFKNNNNKYKL